MQVVRVVASNGFQMTLQFFLGKWCFLAIFLVKTGISWYIMMDMNEIRCLHSSLSDFETSNSVFHIDSVWVP